MKQREIFKNNPQIPIGQGISDVVNDISDLIGVNQKTNKIYVANFLSNTVSVINSNTGNVTNNIHVGIEPNDNARIRLEIYGPVYAPTLDKNYWLDQLSYANVLDQLIVNLVPFIVKVLLRRT